MTNAILLAGIGLAIVLAVLMLSRDWRLPAFLFGLLAMPGNVDDLLPQMRLDPNDIADSTAPVLSVVDLLLIWAVILTIRERRPVRTPRVLLGLVAILVGLAAVSAVAAIARGVEPGAAVRGVVVFAGLAAVLSLAGSLIRTTEDAFRLALGAAGGGAILLANGIYTSTIYNQDRFTATTFGRNTFAIALVVVTILAASIVFSRWSRRRASRADTALVIGAAMISTATLFGAVATGTRMSLVALAGAGLLMLLLNRGWRSRAGIARVGAILGITIAIVGSASLLTAEGGRTVSIFTTPGATFEGVTDPGSMPVYSEIRSRAEFWSLAIQMAQENPLTGVGPFQWNVQRYRYSPFEPLVADVHNAYLQTAAEYGLPLAIVYLILLVASLTIVLLGARRPSSLAAVDVTVAAISAAAFAYAVADLTNSNLFNVRMGLVGWLLIAVAAVYGGASREPGDGDPASVLVG